MSIFFTEKSLFCGILCRVRLITVFKRNYFGEYEFTVFGQFFVISLTHKLKTRSVGNPRKILFGFAVENVNAVVIHSFGKILSCVFGVL